MHNNNAGIFTLFGRRIERNLSPAICGAYVLLGIALPFIVGIFLKIDWKLFNSELDNLAQDVGCDISTCAITEQASEYCQELCDEQKVLTPELFLAFGIFEALLLFMCVCFHLGSAYCGRQTMPEENQRLMN